MIIKCDTCGTHVMPMRDGICPCCRAAIQLAVGFRQRPHDLGTKANAEAEESKIRAADTLSISDSADPVDSVEVIPVPIDDSDNAEKFQEAWRNGVPEIRNFLPVCEGAGDDAVRLACLCELIEHDLQARWCPRKPGRSVFEADALNQPAPNRFRLQDYIEQFPQLGTFADLPTRLIAAEFRVRLAAGDAPQLNEYTANIDSARRPEITDAILDVLNKKMPRRPVLCHGLLAAFGRSLQLLFFVRLIGGPAGWEIEDDFAPAEAARNVSLFIVSGATALSVALIALGKFHPHDVRRVIGWRIPTWFHTALCLAVPVPVYLLASSVIAIGFVGWSEAPVLAVDWTFLYQAYAELAREPVWVMILVGCLLPAVAEEIFFRAFMGRGLVRAYGPVAGVLLTSLIFGLFHVRPGHVVFAFFLGIILHFVYLTTKSIVAPMIVHAVNNLFAFTGLRWMQSGFFNPVQDGSLYIPFGLLFVGVSTAAFLALLFRKSRCRWVVGGIRTWTPGFVSAEMPPALIPAELVSTKVKPSLKIVAAVSYLVLVAGIGMTVNSWIGLTHANRALSEVNAGRIALAVQSSKQAIAQAAYLAWTHSVRALVLTRMSDLSAAKQSCAAALKLDRQIGLTHRVLGWIAYQESQNQLAVDHCSMAIRLDDDDAFSYGIRGAAEFALGDLESSILDTTAAIVRDPTDALAFSIRGATRAEREQLNPAKADLSRAIELNPSSAFALSYRARVNYELGDFAKAIDDAREALELEPHDGHAHYYLGLALQETQQHDVAIESLSRYLEISEEDDDIRRKRAESQIRQQKSSEAIADLDVLIQRNSEDERLYSLRSQAYRQIHDYPKAIADISKAIELKPGRVNAYRSRAEMLQEIGEQSKADADFATADELERQKN
jgi:tetratricopeptide (TPR) repeat protein/membrane protease YdiL (CAAX protease family)